MLLVENGTEFRAKRMLMGLTQQQLADALGVTDQTIWNWESGRRAVPKMAAMSLWALDTWRNFAYVIQPAP